VVLGPILGIVIIFGEEYGWRGYLQSELVKLGRVRRVLLLGVIWGAWHWPIILMGFNYPGHPLLGVVLMTLYTTGLAVVLGYAVLRSGSVLLAAYLHALNNQVVSFFVALGYSPFDPAFSFGIGIYGIATLAIVALLVLRDPVWRRPGSNPTQPAGTSIPIST
jgi:membrane protease YdiL (CAAX protease family)